MTRISYRSEFPVGPDELFDFHRDVANLARISPPLPRVQIVDPMIPTEAGDEQVMLMSAGPFQTRWVAQVTAIVPPAGDKPGYMEDISAAGPFRAWRHQHQVRPTATGAELNDVVEFTMFPTPLGRLLDRLLVAPGVRLMFWWRHRQTRKLLGESTHDVPGP